MTITKQQIDEWRDLADRAVEGPWKVWEDRDWGFFFGGVETADGEISVASEVSDYGTAAFIAAARTIIPTLLDEVELQARLREQE